MPAGTIDDEGHFLSDRDYERGEPQADTVYCKLNNYMATDMWDTDRQTLLLETTDQKIKGFFAKVWGNEEKYQKKTARPSAWNL